MGARESLNWRKKWRVDGKIEAMYERPRVNVEV